MLNLVGYELFDRHKDRAEFIEDKVDALMVAGKLMGYDISFKKMELIRTFIKIEFKNDKHEFSFYFHINDNYHLTELIFVYKNSFNELSRISYNFKSTNRKSIKKILSKAEYIL